MNYSAKQTIEGKEACQAFTAIGRITDDEVFEFVMSETFRPFRRRVNFMPCEEAPIQPLIEKLAFIPGKKRWSYPFRFGLIEITQPDFEVIAGAMRVEATGCKRLVFHLTKPTPRASRGGFSRRWELR